MSEFQYVVFQDVDRPLNDKELAFAERQSSRADVSRWSLSCEYHYSSFRGDVNGLLRRGYDVFLQYTNYGDREIKMRFPNGLPFSKKVWSKYVDGQQLKWKKDSKGSGGILSLHPYRLFSLLSTQAVGQGVTQRVRRRVLDVRNMPPPVCLRRLIKVAQTVVEFLCRLNAVMDWRWRANSRFSLFLEIKTARPSPVHLVNRRSRLSRCWVC